MDENELRIAALEKVFLAVAPWSDAAVIEDGAATIRAEKQAATGQDREACAQALQPLTDGQRRFAPPAMGPFLKGL